MSKTKVAYTCQDCGAQSSKWQGQCAHCQAWNTLQEEVVVVVNKSQPPRYAGYAAAQSQEVTALSDVTVEDVPRFPTQLSELDHVLGGGIVPGSVVLIGGDPGIGKSTLLLQMMTAISAERPVLYVSGEESLQQISMRAQRLELGAKNVQLLAETQVERIIKAAQKEQPTVMVIDSIQTVYTQLLQSAPGGVGQVRESAAQLVQFAKSHQISIFLVGHVTKEGNLAGPRVLEHMVDAVLYFEGQKDSRYRVIRAIKNRFGAVNELGVFAMTDKGLKQVSNPSAIFLSREFAETPGSVVMVTWEGSRPLLVEVQALVDSSHTSNPRRVTVGLEGNRLAMLLAVLHRHGGVPTYDQDVFVNVVGGMRVLETAADLALVFAVVSSLRDKPIPHDWVIFGEIGLAGEIRPVQSGQERLREAAKHGFTHAIVPKANAPKKAIPGLTVVAVTTLQEALAQYS